jgi:hypothetical protein
MAERQLEVEKRRAEKAGGGLERRYEPHGRVASGG